MSERLPYEDQLQQHWNDLPLPDENKAWENMKRRLEEEEDDRPIIAWWRRGCLLWGFLLLVIFGSGFWLIREKYSSSGNNKKEGVGKQEEMPGNKKQDTVIIETIPAKTDTGESQQSTKDETGPLKEITNGQTTDNTSNHPTGNKQGIKVPVSTVDKEKQKIEIKERGGIGKNATPASTAVVTGRRRNVSATLGNKSKSQTQTVPNQPAQDIPLKTGNPPLTNKPDSVVTIPTVKKDSIAAIPPIKQDSMATNKAKKDAVKKKTPITFAAGIAMQQLLPVAGQKAVPYNSQGRKGTLADYIPSVYFRVIKERKWFVQGEFKYGAPQLTKEFVFAQREDTAGLQGFALRTTNTLKKTYYHQLPVTFNYFITKDLSVGGGFTWNKFVKAIVDKEVIRHNILTSRDTVITKGIVSSINDSASNFSKSYFQGVIESQYKWKRFSFGARYSFGLQPYIKFTLLNGEQKQESSSSLHLFLRYELWRSKKKE